MILKALKQPDLAGLDVSETTYILSARTSARQLRKQPTRRDFRRRLHCVPGLKQKGRRKMAFSAATRKLALERAGHQCECTKTTCGHTGRCQTILYDGTILSGFGNWHTHHKRASILGGPNIDDLSNAECLCILCHQNTESYGRS